MTGLAARLYAAAAAEGGNLAISPHSVAVALNLTAYGARGRTRDEIEAVAGDAGKPVDGSEWVELPPRTGSSASGGWPGSRTSRSC